VAQLSTFGKETMLIALKKLFAAKPKVERRPVMHPILGAITYSEEEQAWLTDAAHASLGFRFRIAGEEAPDAALISHAESVARDPLAFRKMVGTFLEIEAERLKDKDDTVRKLEIEMLCLFWPDKPDEGMIYFSGDDRYGVWRCDYKSRKPVGLGFDS
jgi:hypothetical protein